MNGIKLIIFYIIGISLALSIVVWGILSYINSDDNELRIILDQVHEIYEFPKILKSNESIVELILTLSEILERPITKEFVSKLTDGIVETLDLDPYIDTESDKIIREIKQRISVLSGKLNPGIENSIDEFVRDYKYMGFRVTDLAMGAGVTETFTNFFKGKSITDNAARSLLTWRPSAR